MKKIITYSLLVLYSFVPFFLIAEDFDPAHEQEIVSLKYSPKGRFIITGGKDLKIRLWETSSGKMIYARDVEFLPLGMFISPDEKYLIITQNAGRNSLYNLKTGEKIKDLMIEEVAGFTSDSKSIITITKADDGREKYIALGFADLNDESFINYFSYSRIYTKKSVKAPSQTSDGKYLLLADHTKEIYLFKKDSADQEEKIIIDRPASVTNILEGDSSFLINGSSKYYLTEGGEGKEFLEEPTLADANAILYHNRDRIINYNNKQVKIYSTDSGRVIFRHDLSPYKLTAVDPAGKSFVYSNDYTTLVLKSFTDQETNIVFSATDIIERLAFQNYQKAIYFMNKGKYEKARNLLLQAEKKSRKLEKLYYLIGDAYLQMGFSDQALRYFLMDHAIVRGRASYKIAQSFAVSGDYQTSLTWLDSAAAVGIPVNAFEIENDPLFLDAVLSPAFKEKLELLRNKESEKFVGLSEKRSRNKEDLAALEYLTKAISADPGNAGLYRLRARLYLKLKEYEKARNDYMKESAADSLNRAEVYFNIALTYSKQGDLNNTITWIRKGITADSAYLGSMVDIAELYESSYRRDLAINVLNEYLKIVPIDHYAIYLRASMIPVPETAIAEMNKAIEIAGDQGDQVPPQYTELLHSLNSTARR